MRVPKLCLHKSTGRWYATDPRSKREVYFGTDFAHAEQLYAGWCQRFLARVQRVGPRLARLEPDGVTVAELCEAHLEHARRWYVKGGRQTSEVHTIERALTFLSPYALEPASEFRADALEAVQAAMVAFGWCRKQVNDQVGRLRRLFRWGVRAAGITGAQVVELESVPPLQAGRTAAPEGEPVEEVPWETVRATLPHLTRRNRLLVLLHWWTGMRAEELVALRRLDVDTNRKPWVYKVPLGANKNAHKGKARVVYFGPRARAVLRPLLRECLYPESYLFRSRGRGAYSHVRGHLTVSGYRQLVERACDRGGIPHWFPLQLRHSALQRVRDRYGLEAAASIGGHAGVDVTQIYASNTTRLATRVAEEAG